MLSTWGQGSPGPQAWKDAGCVHPSLAGVHMVSSPFPPLMVCPVLPASLTDDYVARHVCSVGTDECRRRVPSLQ